MNPVKLIITNKTKLQSKYGKDYPRVERLLKQMVDADKKIKMKTLIVFVNDKLSSRKAGVKAIVNNSEKEYKRIVDDLFKKHVPAYIVLFGAQDIIPFQELNNPADDEDTKIPSDLPYACDAPFSRYVDRFTGPTRVVGRIPDVPGAEGDVKYFETVVNNILGHKPFPSDRYYQYFAITAYDWLKSTQMTLQSIFGESSKLIKSPEKKNAVLLQPFTKSQLAPMTHFYNCHGAPTDLSYYGQLKKDFPEAIKSQHIPKNITKGTIVAAECCFGAELINHRAIGLETISIANNYLLHGAAAFVGSSTIAYGPADSQSLADLITQFFVKAILQGASSGRALLEARQRFIADSGPDLDPYELKTLAQFYLLGDPSLQPAQSEEAEIKTLTVGNAIMNNRKKLFAKGKTLGESSGNTKRKKTRGPIAHRAEMQKILRSTGFDIRDAASVYAVTPGKGTDAIMQKRMGGEKVQYRTFVREWKTKKGVRRYKALVVKENPGNILGWRTYFSR